MKYLLTIAIPTYNRSSFLNKQLDRLDSQVKNYKDIEILVCDNFSDDNTKFVVQEFQKINPNITYIRQEKNIGFDGNVLSCYENAIGKYIWYLSDDDIIFDDAIKRVYDFLSKEEISVLAFSFCNNDGNSICNQDINSSYRKYNNFSDSKSIEDFFKVIMIGILGLKFW